MIAWKTIIISLLVTGIAAAKNATEAETAKIIAEFQMPEMLKGMIRENVAKECENANAADKTEEAADAVIEFCDCAFRLFAEDSFSLTKLATAAREGKVPHFWKKNCDNAAQFRKCFAAVIVGFAPCAQADMIKSIPIVRQDLESVIDFVCVDDGKRMIPLITEKVEKCVMSKNDALRECHNKIWYYDNYTEALRSMTHENMCAKVDEFLTCAADALRTCSTSAPSDFLDDFVKHFKKTSGSCQVNKRQE